MRKLKNFSIDELVCRHVFKKHGETAWAWIDPRLFQFIEWFRKEIDREVYVNWPEKGFTQRGLRCNICQLVKDQTKKNKTYNSAHVRFQAIDFNVKGMTCDEVRRWIIERKADIPVKIRMEAPDGIERVHIDVCNNIEDKLQMFKG
jgi:hypothetical protein